MQDTGMTKRIFIATFISFIFFMAYDYFFIQPQIQQTQSKQQTKPQKTTNKNETILEWVGYDIEGFRGDSPDTKKINLPNWSGIIDINISNKTKLITPHTNTMATNKMIDILSNGDSSIQDTAIYFDNSNTKNINTY